LVGLLLYVAQRLFRLSTIRKIASQSFGEFVLLLVTAVAIVVTPIEMGVGIGIALSVLHGVWTIAQTRAVPFEQVPSSTVWWPSNPRLPGQTLPGVVVVGFQAPLFFLNAETFRKTLNRVILDAPQPVHAIILEASSIVETDFSGAQTLLGLILFWKDRGVDLYIARLESVRAQEALDRFGISDLLGKQRDFHSVDDAIKQMNSQRPKGDN
jgi:SulP family sulfate permease